MYLPDKMCCRCSLSPLSICCLSLSEFRENKAFQSFLFTYYIIQIKDISQSRDEMEDGDDSSPHSVKYSNHFSIYCSHHQQQHTRDRHLSQVVRHPNPTIRGISWLSSYQVVLVRMTSRPSTWWWLKKKKKRRRLEVSV